MRFEMLYGREKEEIMEKIREEQDMDGDTIRILLDKEMKRQGYLTRWERNARAFNEHPFDLVAGWEETREITGFEIKGDTDTFKLLKDQLNAYIEFCNEVYLVLHKKEVPEWLPKFIGVIRISKDKIYLEQYPTSLNLFDISTNFEWNLLFKACGLGGKTSKRTRELLDILPEIRNTILFNRFFGETSNVGTPHFEKFFPFTEHERKMILSLDVPNHFRELNREIDDLENRLHTLRGLIKDYNSMKE